MSNSGACSARIHHGASGLTIYPGHASPWRAPPRRRRHSARLGFAQLRSAPAVAGAKLAGAAELQLVVNDSYLASPPATAELAAASRAAWSLAGPGDLLRVVGRSSPDRLP